MYSSSQSPCIFWSLCLYCCKDTAVWTTLLGIDTDTRPDCSLLAARSSLYSPTAPYCTVLGGLGWGRVFCVWESLGFCGYDYMIRMFLRLLSFLNKGKDIEWPNKTHTNSRRSVASLNKHIWQWIVNFYIHIWQNRDVTNCQLLTRGY